MLRQLTVVSSIQEAAEVSPPVQRAALPGRSADGFASFNPDLSCSVAMDGNKVGWHRPSLHELLSWAGAHLLDPQYAKEMDNILRRVISLSKMPTSAASSLTRSARAKATTTP